jgi:hypothetical protein
MVAAETTSVDRRGKAMKVELVYFEDCPSWRAAAQRLAALANELGMTVEYRVISSEEEVRGSGFRGSPTILVDGRDPFVRGDEPEGLSCRLFETPDGLQGVPTDAQLHAVLAPAR